MSKLSTEINFDKKIFNDAFYPLLFNRSRYEILRGGGGSSKSYSIADKFIYRCLSETGNRFLFVRAVANTLRNSVYKLFKQRVSDHGLGNYFEFRDTLLEVRVPLTDTEIVFVGMNDRERLKSIFDPTSAWVEEATELDEHDWLQLNIRMRSGGFVQTVATFNPIDEEHWIKSHFFPDKIEKVLLDKYEKRQNRRKYNKGWVDFKLSEVTAKMVEKVKIEGQLVDIDYVMHLSSYEDNRFITPDYKATLELLKKTDYNYWLIYAKAMWGTVAGLVFNPTWARKPFPSSFDEVIYGMDFGFVHPNVLVMVGIKDGEYYIKELFYEKGFTNAQFIEEVKNSGCIEGDDIIYADNHRPEYIEEWCDAGFNVVPALKGNDSVEKGIDTLKSSIIYTNDKNTNLNRELKLFKHKSDAKTGKPVEGEYVKLNDDAIAATRYAIYTHSKQSEVKVGFVRVA